MIEVPPKDTFAENKPLKSVGIKTIPIRQVVPMTTIWLITLERYSSVGFPGLSPGIHPPLFFRLAATSTGLKEMEV